jgi:hypothetical protein
MKPRKVTTVLLWLAVILLQFTALQGVYGTQEKPADTTKGESAKPEAAGKQELVQKIVDVKYANAVEVWNILSQFVDQSEGSIMRGSITLRAIALLGTAENVAKMEEAIKRLDVPPPPTPNIELTAYLLMASEQETTKKLSPDLEGVTKQLKSVFMYSGFRLLDTLMVRCRDGNGGEASGVAPSTSEISNKTFYSFRFGTAKIVASPGVRMIRLDGLKLGVKVPVTTGGGPSPTFSYVDTGTNTDIDVREGQKVVVGKSTIDGSENALFLVLSAKVVD